MGNLSLTVILRIVIIAYACIFGVFFVKDCLKHKEDFKNRNHIALFLVGFITNFFDTLGIGSFATTQAGFKLTKASEDRTMPGTLNVGDCIPVILEFVLFLGLIDVAPLTLITIIASAIVGSLVGARIVSGWSIKIVRLALGLALIASALIMTCQQLKVGPFGIAGTATALSAGKLIIAGVVNFFLGAFMTIGAGLYAPCMATCNLLGLDTKVAFPAMFGACAFLMPSCGFEFIRSGSYDRAAAMWMTVGGVPAIIIAYYIVGSIPTTALKWIVIAVMVYTASMFLRDARRS